MCAMRSILINAEKRAMVDEGDILKALWDGTPIGQISVKRVVLEAHGSLRLEGTWTPLPAFVDCRPLFDEKDRLYEVYSTSDDDEAYDQYVEAIQVITRRIQLPELPGELCDLGIENDK